jgi:hypothetical protein
VTYISSDIERLPVLLRELEDLNVADAIVFGQTQTEERLAGNNLIDSVKPEITQRGQNFAKAFLALHAAHLEWDDYIDSLEEAGASVGAFRIRPNGLSHPRDRSGSYAYGLKDFIDAGLFTARDLPKVLK